jgi:hypothetical protein
MTESLSTRNDAARPRLRSIVSTTLLVLISIMIVRDIFLPARTLRRRHLPTSHNVLRDTLAFSSGPLFARSVNQAAESCAFARKARSAP